jgi:hypothetical protein
VVGGGVVSDRRQDLILQNIIDHRVSHEWVMSRGLKRDHHLNVVQVHTYICYRMIDSPNNLICVLVRTLICA